MSTENPIVKIELWDIISSPSSPVKKENQLAEFFMWGIQELKKTNTIKGIFGSKGSIKNMISKNISDKEDHMISKTGDMTLAGW